jgi:regulation of enolase protein 1 (concanavalin A-like superfamily)
VSIDFINASWFNPPEVSSVTATSVNLSTQPKTDLWQRSYYGFRRNNAPALLVERADNFTFTVRASFEYKTKYDQCGVLLYLDADTWCKASLEYETPEFSRLGSVITNYGHSDWATTDVASPPVGETASYWYRLSRRGPDFLLEASKDSRTFSQLRIFHLHALGETTLDMGQQDVLAADGQAVQVGVYACSPLVSSFEVRFDEAKLEPSTWRAEG